MRKETVRQESPEIKIKDFSEVFAHLIIFLNGLLNFFSLSGLTGDRWLPCSNFSIDQLDFVWVLYPTGLAHLIVNRVDLQNSSLDCR